MSSEKRVRASFTQNEKDFPYCIIGSFEVESKIYKPWKSTKRNQMKTKNAHEQNRTEQKDSGMKSDIDRQSQSDADRKKCEANENTEWKQSQRQRWQQRWK